MIQTAYNGTEPTTSTTVTPTGTTIGWPYDPYPTYTPTYYPYYIDRVVEPTVCTGKAHVFECDHVPACQCGKIQRVMPKPKKAGRK